MCTSEEWTYILMNTPVRHSKPYVISVDGHLLRVITVESGQEFTVSLDSNPSTGCKWYETHDLSLLAFVEKVYRPSQPQPTDGSIIAGG
jgi:predicted secreted protein